MIFVNIEDLKPGMILAEPVYNHQELLLLGAGAKITKKNIRIFKSWGINQISVKGKLTDSRDRGEEAETGVKESIEMKLKEKFSDLLDDPVMVKIFKAASKQLTRSLQNNEKENERSGSD